ncbi:MAG: hypothetical protein ACOC06_07805, partial [Halorubrum sp.]
MSSETDADGSPDGGYVHVPAGETPADETPAGENSAGETPAGEEPVADGFGRKGWALTAVLFTCVLVIPGIIYLYPYAAGWFGLPFFATYLA